MISRFFRWWFGELASLVPRWLSGRGTGRGQYLCLALRDGQVQARLEGSGARALGAAARAEPQRLEEQLSPAVIRLDPSRTRCRVELPMEDVLAREVSLPLAAEENLRDVLAFEMDRQTPFRASDVYFDYRLIERDAAAQRIKVMLHVVRRSVVDPLLAAVRHWELRPVAARNGTAEDVACLEFAPSAFRERSYTGLTVVLALGVALLGAAAVYLPVRAQRSYLDDLERMLDRARVEAAEAVAVRDRLEGRQRAERVLVEAKEGRPSMVVLLEELTRALPDNTYLFRFEVRDKEVSVQGSSASASALIATLEETELLEDVQFASPVTRDGASGRERFNISARLSTPAPRAQPG